MLHDDSLRARVRGDSGARVPEQVGNRVDLAREVDRVFLAGERRQQLAESFGSRGAEPGQRDATVVAVVSQERRRATG
ncbi:MAG: hypothetical protein IPI73_17280 [Betaproteobacteria bacterium]|nr:hypothetical protein [Betaproteobacteria bacterium]